MTVSTDPEKRRSSGLSRELVLHAALQIIDQDGVDGLSMRKLARALTQNHDLTNAFVTGDERGSGLDGASHLGRHDDPCDRRRW